MTYPFEDEDMTSEDTSEEVFLITKEEACALLRECRYSWFSYENPIAKKLISRLMDFVDR
jgi:hypothetical protein